MGLRAELDAFRAECIRTAPPGRADLYDRKVEELRSQFPLHADLKAGDWAPDFVLPDARSRSVSLAERLRRGPVVLTFYRGGWRPYCNIQLRAIGASRREDCRIRIGATGPRSAGT